VGGSLVRRRGAAALALALAGALAGGARRAGAEPAAVDLRVLSYNTHGLPAWIAGDDPVRRFGRIARLVQAYDVVLLQEDFAHHPVLRAGAGGLVVERGHGRRAPGAPPCLLGCQGSGLTFLTRFSRSALLEIVSQAYDACAGWLGGANDCFAAKGFQHARLLLPGDLELHVVNTHLDAGRGPADRAARRAQLARLRSRLERTAARAALVVGGDFNLDAADPEDAALREEFARALGLEDTGAAAAGGPWPRLDYLYRRDGAAVLLQVLEAGEAREFHDGARPLSDHPALFARLRVRPLF
jgi:endonuclease/exonuclease/phosphatase family metal-dependent hydrolase